MREWLCEVKRKGMSRKWSWRILRHCSGSRFEGLKKAMTNVAGAPTEAQIGYLQNRSHLPYLTGAVRFKTYRTVIQNL